jgi:hypothetical protein
MLGALAAAIGGKLGQRLPFAKTDIEEEDRTDSGTLKPTSVTAVASAVSKPRSTGSAIR